MNNNMTQEKLFSLTRAKLIKLAQAHKIENCGRLTKQALVEQILVNRAAALQAEPGQQGEIEEAKYYLGPNLAAGNTEGELPPHYGDTRIVLMVRDPYWLYAYWEISAQRLEQAKMDLQSQWEGCKKIVRVYDVSGRIFDGSNANGYFDLEINGAESWYIEVGKPNRSYCVSLGLLTAAGDFYLLADSNQVTTPQDSPSAFTEEEWLSGYHEAEGTKTPGSRFFEWKKIYQPMAEAGSESVSQFGDKKE